MDRLVQNVCQNEVNQGLVVAFDEQMILENIGFIWTEKILRKNFFSTKQLAVARKFSNSDHPIGNHQKSFMQVTEW